MWCGHDFYRRLMLNVEEEGMLVHIVEVNSRIGPHEDEVFFIDTVQGNILLVNNTDILDTTEPVMEASIE